jgi:hypothetical protein
MRMRGVEPPRAKARRHLKPVRLPVPPHPLDKAIITVFIRLVNKEGGIGRAIWPVGAVFLVFEIYTAAKSGRRICNVIGP